MEMKVDTGGMKDCHQQLPGVGWFMQVTSLELKKKKQCQYPDFSSTNFISYITLQSYKWGKTIVEKYLEIII